MTNFGASQTGGFKTSRRLASPENRFALRCVTVPRNVQVEGEVGDAFLRQYAGNRLAAASDNQDVFGFAHGFQLAWGVQVQGFRKSQSVGRSGR